MKAAAASSVGRGCPIAIPGIRGFGARSLAAAILRPGRPGSSTGTCFPCRDTQARVARIRQQEAPVHDVLAWRTWRAGPAAHGPCVGCRMAIPRRRIDQVRTRSLASPSGRGPNGPRPAEWTAMTIPAVQPNGARRQEMLHGTPGGHGNRARASLRVPRTATVIDAAFRTQTRRATRRHSAGVPSAFMSDGTSAESSRASRPSGPPWRSARRSPAAACR